MRFLGPYGKNCRKVGSICFSRLVSGDFGPWGKNCPKVGLERFFRVYPCVFGPWGNFCPKVGFPRSCFAGKLNFWYKSEAARLALVSSLEAPHFSIKWQTSRAGGRYFSFTC